MGSAADPALGVGRARARRDRPLRPGPAALAARQRALLRRHRPGRPLVRRPRLRPPAPRNDPRAPAPATRAPAPPTTYAARSRASPPPAPPPPARRSTSTSRVDPPQEFSVDIYRIGHYGGDGASKITTSPRLSGIVQPPPLTADRTVSCHHWWLSWRLQIPALLEHRRVRGGPHHRRRLPLATSPSRSATTTPPTCSSCCPTSPGRRTTSIRRTAARAPASTTPGTRTGRLLGEERRGRHRLLRPPVRGRRPAPARRPRLRLHPLGRALRLRPRVRRHPRPARRPHRPHPLPRPGLPRPRRVLVDPHAPHRRAGPGRTAPPSSSSPPTPCTGRWSWARPRPASPTAC